VITIAMLFAVKVISGLRWKRRTLSTLGPACALLAMMLLFLSPQIGPRLAGMVGRDATMTGRTEVWTLSLSSIAERPVLGYGYSAFWNGSEEAARIRQLVGWDVPHAHNAFIDVTLELGIVGFLIFVAAYSVAIRRAAAYVQNNPDDEAKWPLAYMVFTLLYCMTESGFLLSNSILWILFSASAFSVSRPLATKFWEAEVQKTVKSGTRYVPAEV